MQTEVQAFNIQVYSESKYWCKKTIQKLDTE